MTNVTINANNNIFLKPSAAGTGFRGLHGSNSWYDKAARLFDSGFSIAHGITNNVVSIEYESKEYDIQPEILFQAALYEGITNNRLSELLDCYSKGFVGKLQLNMSTRETSSAANPFERASKVLTASDYRLDAIKSALTSTEVQSKLTEFASTNIPDSMTKAQIVELVHSLQDILFPESKKEVFFEMVKKEEAEAAKWKVLTEAGFSDFAKTASGYFANIGLAHAEKGVKELEKAGYKISGQPTVNPDMTLKVFFVEGTVEPLEA